MSHPAEETRPDDPTGVVADGSEGLLLRIAVLTFRRPQDISEALPRLLEQAASVTRPGLVAEVLVIDNDPERSAAELVESFAAAHPETPVRYEHEPSPGISAARNRALSASGDADLLVFIDDDERPTSDWLALLLQTYLERRCAAVVGPVISEFEVEPEPWVVAGDFFRRRRLPTGSVVEVAATNNLLLDLHQVRALGLTFDEQFGISGGGDTMFTRSLVHGGGVMIWNDEAVVIDVVPADRVTRKWVMRRAFRSGNSWSATSLKLEPTGARRALVRGRLAAKGLVRLAGGGARLLAGQALRNQVLSARGMRTLARGSGVLAGVWGLTYQEYARRPRRARSRIR